MNPSATTMLLVSLQPQVSLPPWLGIGLAVLGLALLVAVIILIIKRRQGSSFQEADQRPYLQLKNSERRFIIWPLPFTIGRGEENSLIIDDTFPNWPTVSKDHARIVKQDQDYVIEDLGSQNLLRVQGHPTTQNLLQDSWTVTIGGVEFTFQNGAKNGGAS